MRTPLEHRQAFIDTLTHVGNAFTRVRNNAGAHQVLTFPDLHKLSEGLFLSAWTYWEGLCRDLLVTDLAMDPNGALRHEIRRCRTLNAPMRLAERILNHPDHPEKFVEWADYNFVQQRANEFLGAGHRFVGLPRGNDLVFLKRIRNAIAHRSDRALQSFRTLVANPPFGLTPAQMKGITPGRFISSHVWNGIRVLEESVNVLDACATALVP